MKRSILTFIAFALAACGSSGTLFKTWTGTSGFNLDLSGGQIGTFSMFFDFTNGGRCTATIIVAGTETSGTATVSNSTLTSGTDPGCSSLTGSYSFTVANDTLTLCLSGGSCSTYH